MMQDEIIRMAREAGFKPRREMCVWGGAMHESENSELNKLKRFAALVAAHEAEKWKAENKRDYENWKMAAEKAAECEREACAKVCEERINWKNFDEEQTPMTCAAAIRSRSDIVTGVTARGEK